MKVTTRPAMPQANTAHSFPASNGSPASVPMRMENAATVHMNGIMSDRSVRVQATDERARLLYPSSERLRSRLSHGCFLPGASSSPSALAAAADAVAATADPAGAVASGGRAAAGGAAAIRAPPSEPMPQASDCS